MSRARREKKKCLHPWRCRMGMGKVTWCCRCGALESHRTGKWWRPGKPYPSADETIV